MMIDVLISAESAGNKNDQKKNKKHTIWPLYFKVPPLVLFLKGPYL